MKRARLIPLVEEAWEAYECADSRVRPSMPILFFGDLDAYCKSSFRVVTVGLNPSLKEFPKGSSWKRFPVCKKITAADSARYLDGLCSYFRNHPYSSWFGFYNTVLGGAEASYYPGEPSTALHTDIASPVATDPTWKDLKSKQKVLLGKGVPLWHKLLKRLKPQMVLLSIAREHLERIEFRASNDWRTIRKFKHKKSGEPRKDPYLVYARWYEIMGEPSLFVFGQAAEKPFATLSDELKRRVGEIALEAYDKGPEG